jgi:hypothetical protein
VLSVVGGTIVGLAFCAVLVTGGWLWLRPKPEATTTTKIEQAKIIEVAALSPQEAAFVESLKGSASRLRNAMADVTRLREELASLDGMGARAIDNGIVRGIMSRQLDSAGAFDAARHGLANLLDAEANQILSGAGPSQPPAQLIASALAEEQNARRVVRRLERDIEYVRKALETAERSRP